MSTPQDAVDQNIEMWKVKKLIKGLEAARGYVLVCHLRSQFPIRQTNSATNPTPSLLTNTQSQSPGLEYHTVSP